LDKFSRRNFTSLVLIAGTGLLLAPELAFGKDEKLKYADNLGLQLWSVGELLLKDQEKTLEQIAKLGFKHVELPMLTTVESIAKKLQEFGLSVTSRHFPFSFGSQDWSFYSKYNMPIPENKTFESVVEDTSKHGLKHLVMPFLFPEERGNVDHYKKVANKLNKMGEICQKAGIQLNYHNHSFEFKPIEDTLPWDILINETDESLIKFQIDVFFVYLMGIDPATLIKSMGSRVSMLHLKDMNLNLSNKEAFLSAQTKPVWELWDSSVALGKGLIDFKSILMAAKENNIENCYLEVEGSQANSIDVLKHSFDYIKSLDL